jgi:hypothetical protein
MGHGGARPGAGQKLNSKVSRTQELIERATKDGITPLEYMLKVMRDENADKNRRDAMAEKAAQYIHPKLTAISAPNGGPIALSLEVNFVSPTSQS